MLLKLKIVIFTLSCLAGVLSARVSVAAGCGELVTLPAHGGHSLSYAFLPASGSLGRQPLTLALLAGGSGFVNLDAQACPRNLAGNSLVRSIPLFVAMGFHTALIDAPSDHRGEDGLGGFRIDPEHASDIGKVIADLRQRTGGAVWLLGTSRGSISAANAASRLTGREAPDGVVLTSALMLGDSNARKFWVAQSVFDLPLDQVRIPLLLIGHAADTCVRTPPAMMGEVEKRLNGIRKQVVLVQGGAHENVRYAGLDACAGKTPHGYLGQEQEVADGIARFIHGTQY